MIICHVMANFNEVLHDWIMLHKIGDITSKPASPTNQQQFRTAAPKPLNQFTPNMIKQDVILSNFDCCDV
ncbi:hypothetical protein WI72_33695 [Burkholderia ubonensis]|nr:hypothetical protein WI72_33695 [Burkholderia ubonensis]